MSKLKDKICERLTYYIENDSLSNQEVIDICKHALGYLNLTTVSEYAKLNNMSRQGVYKFRKTESILKQKFVVDNA